MSVREIPTSNGWKKNFLFVFVVRALNCEKKWLDIWSGRTIMRRIRYCICRHIEYFSNQIICVIFFCKKSAFRMSAKITYISKIRFSSNRAVFGAVIALDSRSFNTILPWARKISEMSTRIRWWCFRTVEAVGKL